MTSTVTNWGQALDYTKKVKWKRLPSYKTNEINTGHITAYAGRSFPLSRMAKAGWWMELISDLQDEHPRWSTSTVNRVISAGTTVVKFTHKAGLHKIECPSFDRLKEGESRMTYFTKEQVDKLAFVAVDIFERQDLADAIIFSAYTGLRQAELLSLRVEDIDLSLDTIWVGGKPGRETKGKNVRAVPIHGKLVPILNHRLTDQPATKKVFGDDWSNKDELYRAFVKVRKFCNITEDHVWHSLRHSFGTYLGEVCHPRQIMALMGHKQIDTSLRYVKATDSALRNAVDSI